MTRNGKPAAALVPIDECQALEESAEILSDPDALTAIEQGLADLKRGDEASLEELRAELAGVDARADLTMGASCSRVRREIRSWSLTGR